MNIESLRDYCLSKKGSSESFPFDKTTLVFKVMGKMFALTDLADEILRVNLKCDPEEAIRFREEHAAVLPGYHMHKKNWNTVMIDGSITDEKICAWIDNSYNLVVASLSLKIQSELKNLE